MVNKNGVHIYELSNDYYSWWNLNKKNIVQMILLFFAILFSTDS